MGIYEEHCRDFALHGNPAREHFEHEESARYDYLQEAYGSSVPHPEEEYEEPKAEDILVKTEVVETVEDDDVPF